ncbi:DUF1398 domain-containing protein [Emticicia sp. BO119]|uniref:DUF1398 domain-containing protein n=1 Tax=Emticicia sp. BO119 TaxID=2757768 RepID=UPI0015F01EAB|nr:DUF1398 family protein [Emticicia sp. BO119]MBA4852125.1 DUF1398 family protein [Emticicia sp. BO119]
MFTLDQINEIHNNFGKKSTLPQYLHALNEIGVMKYDSFITDGHSEYYGAENQLLVSSAIHEKLAIAETSNLEALKIHLELHAQGKTDYFQMIQGLADSGVEKWTFNTSQLTIAYYDKAGNELLADEID